MIKFFNPAKTYLAHKQEFDNAIQDCLARGDLILRGDIEEFEKRFAEFIGTKYCVALSSGTDALYLSLKALGIKGNVALPSHTFKATCGAVINAGAKPYLYDIDNIIVESLINWKPGRIDAYIPVHIAGEISKIHDINVPIIEDACQAVGAIKNPTSDVQCWSFYPAKILGAFGDAGAITTNREDVYEYVKEARNHFKTDNRDFGGNHRMDNLQAAILNVRLNYIDEILARRKEIAERYLEELKDLPIGLPNNQKGRVWQDWILRTEKRDELFEYLKEQEVETIKNEYPFSPQYPKLPLAAKYEVTTLRIPLNENLEDIEVEYIIKKIKEFYEK